jgi:hypothetical protein
VQGARPIDEVLDESLASFVGDAMTADYRDKQASGWSGAGSGKRAPVS